VDGDFTGGSGFFEAAEVVASVVENLFEGFGSATLDVVWVAETGLLGKL
jgi:hypothetical protein